MYSLQFTTSEIIRQAQGDIPGLSKDHILNHLIPLPPASEQNRIAEEMDELLSDVNAGVAALERTRAKLKRYRASVLKAAVEGALTAEWRARHPQTEPAGELLRRILIERRRMWESGQLAKFDAKEQTPPKDWRAKYIEPPTLDTTGFAILPTGWCWSSLAQLGDIQGGVQKTPLRSPKQSHFPYLRVANVLRGSLNLTNLHRFELTMDEIKRLRLEIGDILIVEGNGSRTEIGRCALWKGEVPDCAHQNHIIRVRLAEGLSPKYASLLLNSPIGQDLIQWIASSTSGLYTLSVSKVEQLPFMLPPTDEQDAIVDAVEDQMSVIDHLESTIHAKLKGAQSLRQSILRHAFAGHLLPQDPSDEPASDLLKRIAADRAALTLQAPTAMRLTKRAAKTKSAKRGRPRKVLEPA
jgi:type I restriction enzyme S subunit